MSSWNTKTWFPWEQPAIPMFLLPTFTPCFEPLRKRLGVGYFQSVLIFDGDKGTWLFRPAEARALGMRMIDYLIVPKNRSTFDDACEEAEVSLSAAIEGLKERASAVDLKELSVNELLNQYDDLQAKFAALYVLGSYVEPIQMATEEALGERINSLDDASRRALLSPVTELYSTAILRSRLRVAQSLRDGIAAVKESGGNASWPLRTWGDEDYEALLASLAGTEAASDIASHLGKFSWSANNYARVVHQNEHDALRDLARNGHGDTEVPSELAAELEAIDQHRDEAARARAHALDHFTAYERSVYVLSQTIGIAFGDRRKALVNRTVEVVDLLLTAIASATKHDAGSLHYLFPHEVGRYLKNEDLFEARLRLRRERVLLYQADTCVLDIAGPSPEGRFVAMDGPVVAEGREACNKLLDELDVRLDLTTDPLMQDDVVGAVSNADPKRDIIEGVVHVVRDPKRETIEVGEILVASSTTPDFLDAMRAARAIVTDWGGQSSHAALTSRELGIPCITGTGSASYIFKTGDLVSLDFKTGRVQRVEACD